MDANETYYCVKFIAMTREVEVLKETDDPQNFFKGGRYFWF